MEVVHVSEDGDYNYQNTNQSIRKLVIGIFCVLIISGVLSTIWVQVIATFAVHIVLVSLGAIVVVNVAGGVYLWSSGDILSGLLLFITAISSLIFFIYIRPRIAFAITNLKVATKALLAIPTIAIYVFMSLCQQVHHLVPRVYVICLHHLYHITH
jgi:hypothetical protein